MFKKVFSVFSKKEKAPQPPAPQKPATAPKGDGGVLNKITGNAPASAPKAAPAAKAAPAPAKAPEEICGVTAKMNKDEIKARLALLYRRYNRATSSLDPKLRAEADTVLDAVVAVREKTFGPI